MSSDPLDLRQLIGKNFFFMTMTFYYLGKVEAVGPHFITLEAGSASLVYEMAETEPTCREGALRSSGFFPQRRLFISRAAIMMMFEWSHAAPVASIFT